MRLFVNKSVFVSVIKQGESYSCQVMQLVHGIGLIPATCEDNLEIDDIISVIVSDIEPNHVIVHSLESVFRFHKEILLQI